MKQFSWLNRLAAFAFLSAICGWRADAGVKLPPNNPAPLQFAAAEIERATSNRALAVDVSFEIESNSLPQSYRILREANGLRVVGGDAIGAMYGGLDVAEAIRLGTLTDLKRSEERRVGKECRSRWSP